MSVLRLLLSDHLSLSISSLDACNKSTDFVLMAELKEEMSYVKHHKKKIAFLLSAMRHFAQDLNSQGYRVLYTKLDDPKNTGSLKKEVARVLKDKPITSIVITHPSEYRVFEEVKTWTKEFKVPVEIRPDSRFLCSLEEFESWAQGKKQLRMEFFYREMRKKYQLLMEGDEPAGGKWNYDRENRSPLKEGLRIPQPYQAKNDRLSKEVMSLVDNTFSEHFGDLEPFYFALTREQALEALKQFINERLVHFGQYQDAMIEGEPWLFHSHLSFYLNCGLLLPLECVEAAQDAYLEGAAPLNAVEGFIRQIIGWREYVRGIYWLKMPDYEHENFFKAKNSLPSFYWDAKTEMNCLKQCVLETKKNAYAHHIQRLMILGNFALLAGINPLEVNEWFWIVYADAYQWVELPNVSGMILFADGGYLASKPYAAGGSYINKMSNYCKNCSYKVSKKTGPEACPFNYLYWNFLAKNQDKLESNPRMGMMYKTYAKMEEDKKREISKDSHFFLKSLKGG